MSTSGPDFHPAERFVDLHRGPEVFVLANAWDAGTARLLAGAGFAALGTTSCGLAHSLGRRDGANRVTVGEALRNAEEIVGATPLPVSADLEDGFGVSPETVAATIRAAGDVGLAGGSIEDTTGDPDEPIHPFDLAVERVEAAAAEARRSVSPFTLTARADGFLFGHDDLHDIIRRLQAFERAGADVLYAPGLPDVDAIRAVCSSVTKPVNVLAAGAAGGLSVARLGELGARRVSLGSALSRTALDHVLAAAREIAEHGTFARVRGVLSVADADTLMEAT